MGKTTYVDFGVWGFCIRLETSISHIAAIPVFRKVANRKK